MSFVIISIMIAVDQTYRGNIMCFGTGTAKLCSIKGGNSEKTEGGYFHNLPWDQVTIDTGDGVWDLPEGIDKKWSSIKIEVKAGEVAVAKFEYWNDDGQLADTREVFLSRLEADFSAFDRNEERIPCSLSRSSIG